MEEEEALNIPNPGQVAAGLVAALKGSTALRSRALQQLDDAHQTQQAALTIEAARIAERYGADSARGKAIQARVATQAARGIVITAERQRTQIQVPDAQPNAFIIYGLVRDSAGNPEKGVKVEATDPFGALITSTQSDGGGVFQITVHAASAAPHADKADAPAKPASSEAPAKSEAKVEGKAEGKAETKPEKTKPDKAAATHAAAPKMVTALKLVLTDPGTGKVYRDPETFTVTAGVVVYREIAMP